MSDVDLISALKLCAVTARNNYREPLAEILYAAADRLESLTRAKAADLIASCIEMREALRAYELDVDEHPTGKHRMMLDRADVAIAGITRAKEPVHSDEPLLVRLDKLADSFGESFFEQSKAGCVLEAIETIKSATRATEPSEGSVEFRFAFASNDRFHSAYGRRKDDGTADEELMTWAVDELAAMPSHQGYFVIHVPPVKVPTIQAEVVEVPNG